jgi:hypothetical protein
MHGGNLLSGGWNPLSLVVVGCCRHLSGHGPPEARQLPRNGHSDHVGRLPSGDESSGACTEPDLGLPAEVLDDGGWLFESQLQRSAPLGWVAIGPGAFDQSPSDMGVAGLGDSPRPALLTGGLVQGTQAQAFHQCSWVNNTREIANC